MSRAEKEGDLSAWEAYEVYEEDFEMGQDAAAAEAGRKKEDDAGGSSTQVFCDELNSEASDESYVDPYLSEDDELGARIDERMEKFDHRKMELLFESKFKDQFRSFDDFLSQDPPVLIEFIERPWFFNCRLDGDIDEYARLCLIQEGSTRYYDIGSSLESDLAYPDFLSRVYEAMKLDNSYEECLAKAKEIRDASMPFVDENLLDTCVHECREWLSWRSPHDETVELLVEIVTIFTSRKRKYTEENSERELFSKVLIDIATEKRDSFPRIMDLVQYDLDPTEEPGSVWKYFDGFRNYLKSQKLSKEVYEANLQYLVSQFLEKFLPDVIKPSHYVYYVMEKMQYASTLGLLEKDVANIMCEKVKMLESRVAFSKRFLCS